MSLILFDLDGVILEKSAFSRRLQVEHGISPDKTGPFFRGSFVRCQLGAADLKEELGSLLPSWGWKGSVEEFLSYWFQCDQQITPEIIPRDLTQRGHKCYLATNQEKYRASYLQQFRALAENFVQFFCSNELGHRKPDVAFFAEVERRLGAPPSELFFWDDAMENVQGAKACGWTAYLYTDVPAFRNQLNRHFPG